MVAGKSIKLFLVDGVPTGLISAEIGQWTGKAVVCSQTQIDKLFERDEVRRPGIYILQGADPDEDDRDRVYIGEAEDVSVRLKQHIVGKDFWTRVCVFTASDESLTKSHIKYLEAGLYEKAQRAAVAILDNANVPRHPVLPESDRSDMDHFLEHVLILLPLVGMPFAQSVSVSAPRANGGDLETKYGPDSQRAGAPEEARAEFVYKPKQAFATAIEQEGQFVVLKGSTAMVSENPSIPNTYKKLRRRLVERGKLQMEENGNCFRFTDDVAFSSPSAAADVICGSSINGRTAWLRKGTTENYGQWLDRAVERASARSSDSV